MVNVKILDAERSCGYNKGPKDFIGRNKENGGLNGKKSNR